MKRIKGEYYTPRVIVKLLVSFVFEKDRKEFQGVGKVRIVYKPCCEISGILIIGEKYIHDNINKKVDLRLLGQELNPQTCSICRLDMMIISKSHNKIR